MTTHERTSWGNDFAAISTDQVTAQRNQGQGADGAGGAVPAAQPVAIDVADDPTLGQHLATESGLTIYRFVNDGPTGKSHCYEPCIHRWIPLLTSEAPTAGDGIDASLIGTTERDDGTVQAIAPETGEIRHHSQYTPNETWDYDEIAENILIDLEIDGVQYVAVWSGWNPAASRSLPAGVEFLPGSSWEGSQ